MAVFPGRIGGRDEVGGRPYEVKGDHAGRSCAAATIGS
jgi:hypothetical protein